MRSLFSITIRKRMMETNVPHNMVSEYSRDTLDILTMQVSWRKHVLTLHNSVNCRVWRWDTLLIRNHWMWDSWDSAHRCHPRSATKHTRKSLLEQLCIQLITHTFGLTLTGLHLENTFLLICQKCLILPILMMLNWTFLIKTSYRIQLFSQNKNEDFSNYICISFNVFIRITKEVKSRDWYRLHFIDTDIDTAYHKYIKIWREKLF